jgi:hypothetical protein
MPSKRSQLRQLWSESRWILLAGIWLVGLFLSYQGFARYSQEYVLNWSMDDIIYSTLQLIIMESGSFDHAANWMLKIARFMLPSLTAFTALQALMHLFYEQTQWFRLWWLRDHVIICGFGRKGQLLAKEILALGQNVVVIEKEPDRLYAGKGQKQGIIFLNGDATDQDVLASARVHRARHLICLLGEDRHNLQVSFQAQQLTRGRRNGTLTCIVHLASADLLNLLKHSELFHEAYIPFQLETFNPYIRAAQQLLHEDASWQASSDQQRAPEHLLVIGLGRLGENLVIQAAYLWHILQQRDRLHITILDREAKEKTETLLNNYPQLGKACQFNALQVDVSSTTLLQNALQMMPNHRPIQRVYICLSDPVLSLQICLSLLQNPALRKVPIRVRIEKESGLSAFLEKHAAGETDPGQVMPFDLYERTCSATLLMEGPHEHLARELHERYRIGNEISSKNLPESLPWDQLSEELKAANRHQANRIYRLLNAVGYQIYALQNWAAGEKTFTPEEVDQMARLEHDLWRQTKLANGWQFGQQKNEKKRTHPDLVEWEQLPESEREKNRAMVRQLPKLLAQIGYQIE